MESKRIKVGNEVAFTTFSGKEFTAKVVSIEHCSRGEKNGRRVDSAPFGCDKDYTFILSNGKWCYGYQIVSIINN